MGRENGVVIERKLKALFVYFELFRQITRKPHELEKVYASDLRVKQRQQKQIEQQKVVSKGKLKYFDLDYVAQKMREKTLELEREKEKRKCKDTGMGKQTENE